MFFRGFRGYYHQLLLWFERRSWKEVSYKLYELLKETFGGKSEIYRSYKNDRSEIDSILQLGAEKARAIATPTLDRIREKIGIR